MKRSILNSIAVASLCFVASLSSPALAENNQGGFSLGGTRVIYKEEQKEATVTVINSAKNAPFLAQSWMTQLNADVDKSKPPFVITPPLYRQDEGKNTLRIMRTGGNLPTDRESAYWLNVKAIPAQAKENQNKNLLSFAFVLRIKMFYRPSGLSMPAQNAYKSLTFSREGDKLIAHNPTPYHISFNKMRLGNIEIKDVNAMVPPMGQQSYILPSKASGEQVKYKTINDLGGVTQEESKLLGK
ncbi:molecular chaperone [Pantoea sp. SO10]|uniref:fimbrial biogenesis chaperone n=1 Tax=Pantoea sp. SO10 TaxID=2575375 RepID=UPI0010C9824A|nr:molecular chaperone [Pantoea sp. SO10]QCP60193.1 molecular chaperone [Pantoea sp. SO10]